MPTEYVFDLNRITYREITKFSAMPQEAQTAETIRLVAKCLVSWPHKADITTDNIEELGIKDFATMQNAFKAELDAAFESGKN